MEKYPKKYPDTVLFIFSKYPTRILRNVTGYSMDSITSIRRVPVERMKYAEEILSTGVEVERNESPPAESSCCELSEKPLTAHLLCD